MKITTSQLNQIAALTGITDKNVIISIAIKTLIETGLPVRSEYDAVLGDGAFKKMANDIYDSMKVN